MDADPVPDNAKPVRRRRIFQLIEVAVFLSLIVPSMAISFISPPENSVSFRVMALSIICRDLALVALILYFLWRNREPRPLIGWRLKNPTTEIALGVALFVPLFYGAALLDQSLRAVGLYIPAAEGAMFAPAEGAAHLVLASIMVVVVAVSEETIFRGYLMLRFRAISRSPLLALLASSVIFSIGHRYEGSSGMITVGVMGFIFGWVYLWRQSLVAPMVMHFLQDFISIVLLPLFLFR